MVTFNLMEIYFTVHRNSSLLTRLYNIILYLIVNSLLTNTMMYLYNVIYQTLLQTTNNIYMNILVRMGVNLVLKLTSRYNLHELYTKMLIYIYLMNLIKHFPHMMKSICVTKLSLTISNIKLSLLLLSILTCYNNLISLLLLIMILSHMLIAMTNLLMTIRHLLIIT